MYVVKISELLLDIYELITHNLQMNNLFNLIRIETVPYGVQSAVFLGCSLWLKVPDEAKNSKTIDDL